MSDAPSQGLAGLTEVSYSGQFETFQMYQPPGARSRWVALHQINWQFNGHATLVGTAWVPDPANGQSATVLPNVPAEPTWDLLWNKSRLGTWVRE
jgi:hypothetical protein